MEYAIRTNKLTKKYGDRIVVNEVSMNVKKGDIYGFIGRNGAGKTTTMKMILGLTFGASGDIEINESYNLDEQRKKIGSLIEAPGIYKDCTAYENMKRMSILTGGTNEEINDLLNFVGLGGVGKKKAGQFSLGMKQRLGIAIALIGNPEILVLDEPINGLDPAGIKEVRDLILKINQERNVTILISSHLLDELAKVVDTYGIINNGVLVDELSKDELESKCKHSLDIVVDNPDLALSVLNEEFNISDVKVDGNILHVTSNIDKAGEINRALNMASIMVPSLSVHNVSLEEYFIERIGK